MLKRRALKKIFVTTFTVVLLLTIYFIPTKGKEESLAIDPDFQYIDISYQNIYLLNDVNQLVRTPIKINADNFLEKVKIAINNLILSNSNIIPYGLNGVLPKNTEILDIRIDEGILSLQFSDEILEIDTDKEEQMIESISYTAFEFDEIEGIVLYVGDKNLNEYLHVSIPSVITRDFGINKEYDVTYLDNIEKIVVYYIDEINDKNYYVPVTKYINDDRDKIKIIIDELRGNSVYSPNLISYLDRNAELIHYEINNDVMMLHFNNSIFMSGDTILEEVVYSICYSVFDNYDVESVSFLVDNKEILKKMEKDIE